jgi:RHS repeat-associated protein
MHAQAETEGQTEAATSAPGATGATWGARWTSGGGVSWSWDPDLASKYYRARYYDPKVGRFISEDPIGFEAGPNFYAYVNGNPVNLVDPSGLESGATFHAMWGHPTDSDRLPGNYRPYTCAEKCDIERRDCYLLHGPPAFAAGAICKWVCKVGAPTFRVVCSLICTAGATSWAQTEFLQCYAKFKECTGACNQTSCGGKQ